MDKNGSLLCVPVKVTGIGCSFFSSCVLLGESFVLTHAVPVNGDWSCTERRKCPILKAAWQGDSWEDLCCWCTSEIWALPFIAWLFIPKPPSRVFCSSIMRSEINNLRYFPYMARNVFVLAPVWLRMRSVLGTALGKSRGRRGSKHLCSLLTLQCNFNGSLVFAQWLNVAV